MNKLGLILFSLSLFGACKTLKMPQDPISITFGFGGGFSGMRQEYRLNQQGKMESIGIDGLASGEGWQHTKPKKLIPLFLLADSVKKNIPQRNSPGNIYQYIRWGNETQEVLYMWDPSDTSIHEPVKRLFGRLMETQIELINVPTKK